MLFVSLCVSLLLYFVHALISFMLAICVSSVFVLDYVVSFYLCCLYIFIILILFIYIYIYVYIYIYIYIICTLCFVGGFIHVCLFCCFLPLFLFVMLHCY